MHRYLQQGILVGLELFSFGSNLFWVYQIGWHDYSLLPVVQAMKCTCLAGNALFFAACLLWPRSMAEWIIELSDWLMGRQEHA